MSKLGLDHLIEQKLITKQGSVSESLVHFLV